MLVVELPTAVAVVVGPRALQVYGILAGVDPAGPWPSVGGIAAIAGCSERTVSRAIRCLVAAGVVQVDRRRDPSGWIVGSSYVLGGVR